MPKKKYKGWGKSPKTPGKNKTHKKEQQKQDLLRMSQRTIIPGDKKNIELKSLPPLEGVESVEPSPANSQSTAETNIDTQIDKYIHDIAEKVKRLEGVEAYKNFNGLLELMRAEMPDQSLNMQQNHTSNHLSAEEIMKESLEKNREILRAQAKEALAAQSEKITSATTSPKQSTAEPATAEPERKVKGFKLFPKCKPN